MRDNVRAYVESVARTFPLAGPVYEFGSYLVEGQEDIADLRPLFPNKSFVGCDMRHGPGVDQVEDVAALSLPDGCAATIVCVETLEHVFESRKAVEEMIRVLAPGGVIVISTPMNFRIHDYPGDYWRITPGCMARLLSPLAASVVGWQGVESHPHTVFGLGCKAPVPAWFATGIGPLIETFKQRLAEAAAGEPWLDRVKRRLIGWTRSRGERRKARDYHHARFTVHLPLPQDWKASLMPAPHAAHSTGSRIDLS